MKRSRLNSAKSRARFHKTAKRTKSVNAPRLMVRGGIRL